MEINQKESKRGFLIVIEGIDSSGKATQTELLYKSMKDDDKKVRKIEFPDYKSNSSALIKMYLNGDFGENPQDINPYAASIFFAVDRFASFNMSWKSFYENGGIVICDRYVTSNMIYQAAKFDSDKEREEYLEWLTDLEFKKLQLPIPNLVIFLSVPPSYCLALIKERLNKFTGNSKKDIHEKDEKYMRKTYDVASVVSAKYNWKVIDCIENECIMSIEKISSLIKEIVYKEIDNR